MELFETISCSKTLILNDPVTGYLYDFFSEKGNERSFS